MCDKQQSGDCDPAELFMKHKVIPDVVPVAPLKILNIEYENDVYVNMGDELTPTQVRKCPQVHWDAKPDTYYMLIMTDPDAPSRKTPKFREWHHWLVVNIPGNDVAKGEELTAYVGSGPPQGTGLHRYIFLVYEQPTKLKFKESRIPKTSGENRAKFNTDIFVKRYKMAKLVAGNLFQAQWDDYVPKLYKQLSGKK